MSRNIRKRVIIVGAGPAGLTAAIYCARANLDTILFTGSELGGHLSRTTYVENFPGFPDAILGSELAERMKQQAIKYDAKVLDEKVISFRFGNYKMTGRSKDYIKTRATRTNRSSSILQSSITLNSQQEPKRLFRHKVGTSNKWYLCDAVILAMGSSPKWLELPNEEKYKNNGVSTCAVCDGPLPVFRNKDIYVVGGGDSAAEEALFLTKFAKKVYVLVRSDRMKASKIMQKRLFENQKIEVMFNTEVVSYIGNKVLEGLVLKNNQTMKKWKVKTPGLFIAIGHNPNTRELEGTGIELDEKGYIITRDQVYTNIDGVFTAGDIHDVHYKQAITAAGFGCMAAISVERWLNTLDY